MGPPPLRAPWAETGDVYSDSADPQDWPMDRKYVVARKDPRFDSWPWRPLTTMPVLWVEDARTEQEVMDSWFRDPETLKGTVDP